MKDIRIALPVAIGLALGTINAQAASVTAEQFEADYFTDSAFITALTDEIKNNALQNKATVLSPEPHILAKSGTAVGFYPSPKYSSTACDNDYVNKSQTCTLTDMQYKFGNIPTTITSNVYLSEIEGRIPDFETKLLNFATALDTAINQLGTDADGKAETVEVRDLGTFKTGVKLTGVKVDLSAVDAPVETPAEGSNFVFMDDEGNSITFNNFTLSIADGNGYIERDGSNYRLRLYDADSNILFTTIGAVDAEQQPLADGTVTFGEYGSVTVSGYNAMYTSTFNFTVTGGDISLGVYGTTVGMTLQ